MPSALRRRAFVVAIALAVIGSGRAAPPTGYLPEVQVSEPTRFDWPFVARNHSPEPGPLPREYDSRRQFYVLHAPKEYDPARAWPLLLFVSPGDDPFGWRLWEKACREKGLFFCAAYGAGNRTGAGERARIILDALDDVRRHYRIDPDHTYAAGHAGAGRFACALAFSLPEHFAGVVLHSGSGTAENRPGLRWTETLYRVPYLRSRARERLSVAVVNTDADAEAEDAENYLTPLLGGLGLRTRAWRTDGALGEVLAWLEDGLPARQADAKVRPTLAVAPGTIPPPAEQAERLVRAAEGELALPAGSWRGVALLEGTVSRWPKTEAAEKASRRLRELLAEAGRRERVQAQRSAEERQILAAEAEALEQSGRLRAALDAWAAVRKSGPGTPEGMKAANEVTRLETALAEAPYLGAAFAGNSTTLTEVVPGGPAARAGLQPGDAIARLGGRRTATLVELRRVLARFKAGSEVELERTRDGKSETVAVRLTAIPAP
jgi:hypothetical protein